MLLQEYYGIQEWDIPDGFLCPPIPGRADYVHSLADLLAVNFKARGQLGLDEAEPRGQKVRVLDIGTGASAIYPLIGVGEYDWSFVGSDVNPEAIASAQQILGANPKFKQHIELRLQIESTRLLQGIIQPGEQFEATMSNPPFHASAFEAAQVNQRKWKNLGKTPVANFGGQHPELWVEGGEVAFIQRHIRESVEFSKQVLWFTSLVSKESSLKPLYQALSDVKVLEYRVMDMAQGQKRSRVLAWTFLGGKYSKWKKG